MQVLETWKPTKDMKFRLEFFFTWPALIQVVFHVSDCFWAQENWHPKN